MQTFNVLQQRLNRKTVSPKLMKEYPIHLRAYDLLGEGDNDLRSCHSKSAAPDWKLSSRARRSAHRPVAEVAFDTGRAGRSACRPGRPAPARMPTPSRA